MKSKTKTVAKNKKKTINCVREAEDLLAKLRQITEEYQELARAIDSQTQDLVEFLTQLPETDLVRAAMMILAETDNHAGIIILGNEDRTVRMDHDGKYRDTNENDVLNVSDVVSHLFVKDVEGTFCEVLIGDCETLKRDIWAQVEKRYAQLKDSVMTDIINVEEENKALRKALGK